MRISDDISQRPDQLVKHPIDIDILDQLGYGKRFRSAEILEHLGNQSFQVLLVVGRDGNDINGITRDQVYNDKDKPAERQQRSY